MFPIEIFGAKTNPATSALNLGVIFDKFFTFRLHLSAVRTSWFYHIWDLRHICLHFDLHSAKLLANVLDYCNSLLYGITDSDLTKLQRIQNWLTRDVTKSLPFTCSVSLLLSLHWLPERFRMSFQISLLTYKALHDKQAVYLHSMLAASFPSHSLRSSKGTTGQGHFTPFWVTSSYMLFVIFRKRLETHLFDLAYPHNHRHAH